MTSADLARGTDPASPATRPLVQIAVDVTDVDSARRLVASALDAGADWVELGKPLIEFVGLRGVEQLCTVLQGTYILVDLMIMAAPARYVDAAARLGASNVTVTALAPDHTIAEAIALGRAQGVAVTVDLFNVADPAERARQMVDLGADHLMVHFGVDQKAARPAGSPIADLRAVRSVVGPDLTVSYATYDLAEAHAATDAGADVVVQGHPLIGGADPTPALRDFVSSVTSTAPRPTITP